MCKIDIEHNKCYENKYVKAPYKGPNIQFLKNESERLPATRLAVTRALAEIGKSI